MIRCPRIGQKSQFPELWYLPVAAVGTVLAFAIAERVEPWRWLATSAAVLYTGLRVILSGSLLAMGHSAQLVPPVIVAGLVFDLTRDRRPLVRAAAITAAVVVSYVPALNLVYRGVRVSVADLAIGVPLILGVTLAILLSQRPRDPRGATAPMATAVIVGVVMLVPAGSALAHDPGQGEVVLPVMLEATADEESVTVVATVDHDGCDLDPVRTVARRAGDTVAGPLSHDRPCELSGSIELPDPARWFVYIEIDHHGERLEAWLPVHRPDPGEGPTSATKDDWLYIPAGSEAFSPGQWTAGIALYLLILGLLVESVRVARGKREEPLPR